MALVKLGAANIDPNASDFLFGETSWQREIFRPPLSTWRPGTRLQRRIAALVAEAPDQDGLPLSQLNADAELRQAMLDHHVPGMNRAWLSKQGDLFEVLPATASSEPRVRMRPAHAGGDASPQANLSRQIEAVRTELEELERQKQRAVAEEEYVQAGVIKRSVEATRAELASLEAMWEEESAAGECNTGDQAPEQDQDAMTYDEQRTREREKTKAKKVPEKPLVEAFTQDVKNEELFPSLISKSAKPAAKRAASMPAESARQRNSVHDPEKGAAEAPAAIGEPQEQETTMPSLTDALRSMLLRKEHSVAHINEVNGDKNVRAVLLAQRPKLHAVNKVWLKQHEDLFVVLRTDENEMFVAIKKDSSKDAKDSKASAKHLAKAAGSGDQPPKSKAYRSVIQRTDVGDPKPLVYQYGANSAPELKEAPKVGAAAWSESFQAALQRLPTKNCSAEELLQLVPLFAAAMGAKGAREQRELLVLFLEGLPEAFRVERRGEGMDKQYTIWAK